MRQIDLDSLLQHSNRLRENSIETFRAHFRTACNYARANRAENQTEKKTHCKCVAIVWYRF